MVFGIASRRNRGTGETGRINFSWWALQIKKRTNQRKGPKIAAFQIWTMEKNFGPDDQKWFLESSTWGEAEKRS